MGALHRLQSVLDQMLKAVKFFWPSDIASVKLLARSELDAAQATFFVTGSLSSFFLALLLINVTFSPMAQALC